MKIAMKAFAQKEDVFHQLVMNIVIVEKEINASLRFVSLDAKITMTVQKTRVVSGAIAQSHQVFNNHVPIII